PAQDPRHWLGPGVRDDDSRQLRREKALDVSGLKHKAAFNLVAGNAKTPWLDDNGDTAAQTTLCQSRQGLQCLLQLIGTNRNELNVGMFWRAGDRHPTLLDAFDRLRAVEDHRHRPLWGDEATDLCVLGIDASQRFNGAIGIDRKQDARYVRHFAEQGLADCRVLVRLLVLAVFPGVRGDEERYADPARRTTQFLLVPGEDDLLPQRAQHLDGKGFIADSEIDLTLIAECGADHGLLIEGGYDGAIDRFRYTALRFVLSMLQGGKRLMHVIAVELVWIADAWPQLWIGLDGAHKVRVNGVHRRDALSVNHMPTRFGKVGQSDLPPSRWVIRLSLSFLQCVDAERRNGCIQLSSGYPKALC